MILLKDATVVNADGIKETDVLIDGGIIAKVGEIGRASCRERVS